MSAIPASTSQVEKILRERRQEAQAVLDSKRDDIYKKYQPLLNLPDNPTYNYTLGVIYSLVTTKMQTLILASMGLYINEAGGLMDRAEQELEAFNRANAETKLIEIVDAANSQINMDDTQQATIQGVFGQLADTLKSLSLDVVGIVTRYAI
ncbi:MAG TPA: hypothetical protein VLG44_00160 [Chlamydiales bacterium]|nr:hypothetical protein [Chlamydiales bacterium]